VRIWADRNGVLSLRRRRMLSPEDIHESLATSQGPTNTGDLLVALVERLSSRMEPMLEHMRNQLEKLEHTTLEEEKTTVSRQESQQKRQMLGQLRISAVAMRRHLMPQREALQRLMTENLSWINDQHRVRLHELINDTTRHLEDLDEIRDTAGIIQDQITGDASAVMNDLLYKLTLVTVFFMPLSFLVGFFGSNVGGMFFGGDPSDPGQDGVLWETAILFTVSLAELLAFRLLRWI
ncbi:MAG: hypothetical protein G8345_21060, partial [Magnetococcales bacterium]|nr:hypothetical protein [Magnetococcales bacterium]